MPVYIWTSQQGTFSQDQRKSLAKAVTDIHCNATGAPRNFVKSSSIPIRREAAFWLKRPLPRCSSFAMFEPGEPLETKRSMLKQLNDAAATIGGISSDALAIILAEIPPVQE